MKKSLFLAAVAVVGFAGAASAVEVNTYGASAQYKFVKDLSKDFLVSLGCDATTSVLTNEFTKIDPLTHLKNTASTADTFDTYIAKCPSASNTGTAYPGEDLILRAVSIASQEGVKAIAGVTGTDGFCGASNNQRAYLNDLATANPSANATDVSGSLGCFDVTLGISDVAAESFVQCYRPAGATADTCVTPISAGSPSATYNPVVVPFAFYVNNQVTDSAAAGATIDTISTVQAQLILGGTAQLWSALDKNYPAQLIKKCFRRPGSGTHATLDAAFFWHSGIAWNSSNKNENNTSVFYNLSSGDMKTCLANAYAIGYMDADTASTTGTTGYTRLKLDGVDIATAEPVATGKWPFAAKSFWWARSGLSAATAGSEGAAAKALVDLAGDPTKLGTRPQWAAQCEMHVSKGTDRGFWAVKTASCTGGTQRY